MAEKRPLVWLASYPKSGNTWLRIFLLNLLRGTDQPSDINEVDRFIPNAANRALFDDAVGVASSDLTQEEIEICRPDAYRTFALRSKQIRCLKIHDALSRNSRGQLLIPPDVTLGILYLIRNPLDVTVSFAYHSQVALDRQIGFLASQDSAIGGSSGRLEAHLRQSLSSWSGHVRSWVDEASLNAVVIRYEDLHSSPQATFAKAARLLDADADPSRIARAIAFSSFDQCSRQERANGFVEKPSHLKPSPFFRKGKVGSWRDALSAHQVNRIIEDHHEVMRRFGYLTESGKTPC